MLNRRLVSVVVGTATALLSLTVLASAQTSAVTFTPSSLTGLKLWVDPSDASTVTSSGGIVSQVTDKSGNGLNLTQTNVARRPATGTSTLSGLNAFTFDGDDSLGTALLSQSLPVTMFAVARNTENNGTNRQIIGNTNQQSPVFYKSSDVWRLYAGEELISSTQVDTDWHYLSGIVNSGSSELRLDGTAIANGSTGSQPWNNSPIWIGDSEEGGGGGFGWIGDIAEVLIYSRVLTSAEITQVESYLNAKWLVAPTPTNPPTVAPTTSPTIAATTPTTTPSPSTTAAPALDIVVNAPTSATTTPIGQSQIPTLSQSAIASARKPSATSSVPSTSVPASATSTIPPPTSNAVAPQPPAPLQANSGSAALKVGGTTTQAIVTRADNQLVVTAGPVKAVVGGLNSDGTPMTLDEAGNVRLKAGSTVRIKSAGFKPDSTVEVWLFSRPVLLGSKEVGSDGTVTATFTIPNNVPDGSHNLVVVAKTNDNKSATLSVGIDIGEWKKESTLTVWLIVLPIVLAVIGALALPATRRKRKQRAIS